jgi:hypothetical protein
MSSFRSQPVVRQVRRWGTTVGMGAGALVAAAMIAAGDAHADTGSDVLGEAGSDLTQATQVLDGAPTASLDAAESALLTEQESLQTGAAAQLISLQESAQSNLPAADQTEFGTVDTQLADAYQGILNADQTFVAADQAGDLTSLTGLTDALGVVEADFGVIPADLNVTATDFSADLANLFGLTDFLSF